MTLMSKTRYNFRRSFVCFVALLQLAVVPATYWLRRIGCTSGVNTHTAMVTTTVALSALLFRVFPGTTATARILQLMRVRTVNRRRLKSLTILNHVQSVRPRSRRAPLISLLPD